MAWTKKCTETTFAGWKQQTNILTIGDIPDKGGGKYTGWNCLTPCWRRCITGMRNGSSINSEAGPSNEREPSETARRSDYHLRSLGETHRGRDGNDVAARGLHPDSDQAGRPSRRTVQDFSGCDTRRSGRAHHQHR